MGFSAHFLFVRSYARYAVTMLVGDVHTLVRRTVEGLGYELVECERAAGGLLRVTLDAPAAPQGVTLDDCERVTRQLNHLLTVENVDYARLEVGSPGLDRPLKTARDFARFVGTEARVQLFAPVDGRKRFVGRLLEVIGATGAERVRLEQSPETGSVPAGKGRKVGGRNKATAATPGKVVEFAVADVEKARLVPQVDFGSGRK
jgi:ribosome maturation factor RimP